MSTFFYFCTRNIPSWKGEAIYQLRNKDIMYFEVWVVKKPMIWHWFYIKVRNKWGSSCKKHYYTELYFTHIWVMKRGREHSSNNWQRKRRAYNSAARGNLLIPTRHNSGHYIYLTDKESSMKKRPSFLTTCTALWTNHTGCSKPQSQQIGLHELW